MLIVRVLMCKAQGNHTDSNHLKGPFVLLCQTSGPIAPCAVSHSHCVMSQDHILEHTTNMVPKDALRLLRGRCQSNAYDTQPKPAGPFRCHHMPYHLPVKIECRGRPGFKTLDRPRYASLLLPMSPPPFSLAFCRGAGLLNLIVRVNWPPHQLRLL